jgi:flavin reductase (DIM6/NTAB) family NADH-FMN oxidoreductase RutF
MRKVELSKVYRLLYPAVPAVVAALDAGETFAMPVVSMISLSNDPPLVGISSSKSHTTYKAILRARRFSVAWLDAEHRPAVEYLGSTSASTVRDKLLASGLHFSAKGSPPVPIIKEARATLVCSVKELRRYGDHELIVGHVLHAEADRDFGEYWNFNEYDPILYTGLGRPELRRPLSKGS